MAACGQNQSKAVPATRGGDGEGEAGAALVVPKEKHNKIKLSEAATAASVASVAASVTRK